MLYLKLMDGQNTPDSNHNKNYQLVQIDKDEKLMFLSTGPSRRYGDHVCDVVALITKPDGSERSYPLEGNAYVINENGKTIAHHGSYQDLKSVSNNPVDIAYRTHRAAFAIETEPAGHPYMPDTGYQPAN